MRFLRVREYQTLSGVQLTHDEISHIRGMTTSLDIRPSTNIPDTWDLTAGSQVGGLTIGDLAIEIQPKLPIDRLLFMLSYSLDRQQLFDPDFAFDSRGSLVEAIIPAFVIQLRRALRRGVLQGYRIHEEALPGVRGRIRFADQLRDRYGLFPPVEVRYDEFTEDILENRLLKAALRRLGNMRIRSSKARKSLHVFEAGLANVSAVEFQATQIPDVLFTRLNERYRSAIGLAKLILKSSSIEVEHGAVTASSFLVDMNQLFEDFVVIALRESLGLSVRAFPQNAKGRRFVLDGAGSISLLPDISWWEGSECRFVGDVKYKRVDVRGINHPDLYQLLAYTIAADLPGGILIYAAGEAGEAEHEIRYSGKRLRIIPLELAGPPDAVLHQIDAVAQLIRRLRRESLATDATLQVLARTVQSRQDYSVPARH